ncbi:cytochrome P450 [Panus rudis PR-1116 ss-1]|nr:cytochrome P450 [Panus rudis PR-1116 ss-1]
MALTSDIPASLALAVFVWFSWRLLRWFTTPSPFSNIPGPKVKSFLGGHVVEVYDRNSWDFHNEIIDKYNSVVRIQGLLGNPGIFVFDPKGLHHVIVKHQDAFAAPEWFNEGEYAALGPCLLAVHGKEHRRQRKLLNPAFSTSRIREMTPLFYRVVDKLHAALDRELGPSDEPKTLNILDWLSRTAMELIAQGGLGYSLDPLVKTSSDEYAEALKALLPTLASLAKYQLLLPHIRRMTSPAFQRKMIDYIPIPDLKKVRDIVDVLERRSKEIYEAKKAALKAGDAAVSQQIGEGKDIMSILLRANMEASDEDKLPEEEVTAQMSLLLFAATDTTSSMLVQVLQLLAEHKDMQARLRAEILEATERAGGNIPYDELMTLPLLDAVCRETLRAYPPINIVLRDALEDTVMPLSRPFRGLDGRMIHEIPIPKGSSIILGLRAANLDKQSWGEDAREWKPERWLSPLPESVVEAKVPGVYSNQMSFMGGPRACIGFKFSELEAKIVLIVLLRSFEFDLDKDVGEVVWNVAGVKFPTLGRDSDKPAFPMRIRRVRKM